LTRETPEVQKVRGDIQKNYDHAYEILSNDAKRAQYLVKYRQDKEKENKSEADKAILGADLEFGRGETFLFWKQDYKLAVEALTNAVKMNPKEPEYLATLALAVYLKDGSKIGQARELINKALSIGPRCDKAYLYMGRILTAEKNTTEAAKFFQKAIDLNPENRKVLKQMLKGEGTGKSS
jgi:tetratricopeptide (TPR) repeat protein